MPTRRALTADQNNDMTYAGTATNEDTDLPLNLAGVTLEMVLKASEQTDDTDGTTLSTTTGEITITDAAQGAYSVAVPDTALTEAGIRWYRLDAIAGTSRKTIVYGPLKVRDL
jgi:hypothetical protein